MIPGQKQTVKNFVKLSEFKVSTKKQVRENLRKEGYTNIQYSGKDRGFYFV